MHMNAGKDMAMEAEDRYLRRIQLTGRGSYIVSVPKDWVEQAGLKKGGRVEFSRQGPKGLLLAPFDGARYEEDESTRCTIFVEANADPEGLERRLISLYVVGFLTIEIMSKSGNLATPVREVIRNVARQKLVGTELVTESAQSATLQVLLTFPQLIVPDALRRMSSIMSSMQQDAVQALQTLDLELAKQVLKIDDEIDRFSLYIIKQLKWAVQHTPLIERIGLKTPVECLGYRMITKVIERSADHAARIGQSALQLSEPISPNILKEIGALNHLSATMMETAIRSLYTQDYRLAESVLEQKEKTSEIESRIVDRLLKEKIAANDLSSIRLISESLRRIGEYATDIAEVVLNLTVRKSIEQPIEHRSKYRPLPQQRSA